MKQKIWKIAGIVAGVLTIAAGIIVMATYGGLSPVTNINAADFYTLIYQAAAYGAYNTLLLARTVSFGFGFLLISLGVLEICYFGMKLSADSNHYDVNAPASAPDDGAPAEGEPEALEVAKLAAPQEKAAAQEADAQAAAVAEADPRTADAAEKAAAAEGEAEPARGEEPAGSAVLSEAAEAEQQLQDTVADVEETLQQAEEAIASLQ